MSSAAELDFADVYDVRRGPLTVSRLHRSGREPHRVLLLGTRALLVPPSGSGAEAFGSLLADRIWLQTRRGVDVDQVWELRPVLLAIGRGLESARLWRYDAVVVLFAARPASIRERWRLRGVDQLLRRLVADIAASTHVLLVSVGAAGSASAPTEGEATDAAAAAVGIPADDARVSRLRIPPGSRAGVDAVVRSLAAADVAAATREGARRTMPSEEIGRQRAVDDLALRERQVQQRLQHVVDIARETFESAAAQITIVDHDEQWTMVAAGQRRPTSPRATALCNRTIARERPTVIADLWTEPDLLGDPMVAASEPIRFYAAHPIESIDGYRIGVLCVWDDVPHSVEDFDASALRDLALLAEAEIITGSH